MKNILNVLKVNKIGESPCEFCVERSCPTAFQWNKIQDPPYKYSFLMSLEESEYARYIARVCSHY